MEYSHRASAILILMGIVVNNGIVLLDQINRLRRSGLARDEAILQTGRERLRPILLTAATTILGLLPLAAATLFDLYVEHPLAREFTVSLAVENLFDETVEVGRLPELRVGPPRLVHLDVRFSR